MIDLEACESKEDYWQLVIFTSKMSTSRQSCVFHTEL